MGHDKSKYLAWRRRYQPAHIELIIVAESPPKSGKYFYDPDGSHTGEPLFAAMMKQLKVSPASKVEGLRKFQAEGMILLDATYEPMNDGRSRSKRKKTILGDYPLLVADLKELTPDRSVRIIVIKSPLCDLLVPRLKADRFNVLNGKIRPPFPSTGQQPKFHEQFGASGSGTEHGRKRSTLMDAAVPTPEAYRAHALECLHEARSVEDREGKQVYHRLAMWWVVLAHEQEDDRPMTQSSRWTVQQLANRGPLRARSGTPPCRRRKHRSRLVPFDAP